VSVDVPLASPAPLPRAADLAARIKSDTAALVSRAGFHEYFDPQTGVGLGGGHFSWTASVALSWPLLSAASGE